MRPDFLETILACPKCKLPLKPSRFGGKCPRCQFPFKKINGVWHLLYIPEKKTRTSLKAYDRVHKKVLRGASDGSYEILAAIAAGNRTVDLACGQGLIEKLAPETVGVEFSLEALKKAKAAGAKYLVCANAHHLPFKNDAFDIAICAGSLEHFANPAKAILEMGRVSRIQIITAHREFDFPLASHLRNLATSFLGVKNQPIERPLKWIELEKLLKNAKLQIVFKGFWTLPVNFGKVFKALPVFKNIPSCFFVITIRQ